MVSVPLIIAHVPQTRNGHEIARAKLDARERHCFERGEILQRKYHVY